MRFQFDVIVVGAGHAGCEAAYTAARMGSKTLLITMDMNKIAQMSCNPAVGGIAKGQIVREIDAMGGAMGIVSDRSAIQFKMLNRSKGPAMWSPRVQSDRQAFINEWRGILDQTDNLFIWQDVVTSLIITNKKIEGVLTGMNVTFKAPSVILTNGTFLNGLMHIGNVKIDGGRISEPASYGLSEQLKTAGFTVGRMKTGTPVRIDIRSIDLSKGERQEGENDFHQFSYLNSVSRQLKQLPCWLFSTNESVHDVLREGLSDSPLYNGQIQSIGPRYCPSIETKIITFADKQSHLLFLEPEGVTTNEYYLNGFSSSLPLAIQLKALQRISGFENVMIYRPGYAIEYDYFDPTQLLPTLETKQISGLFFAGQINGTTGYEEAAGQGMVGAINAHYHAHGGGEFVLHRDEAYIGVLVDDLISKGVDEPYRMFTSRAEYRILLRQDNADARLTEKAYDLGLVSRERLDFYLEKKSWVKRLDAFIHTYSIKPDSVNSYLESLGSSPLKQGVKLENLVLRPQLTIEGLATIIPALQTLLNEIPNRRSEIVEEAEISLKYKGYIEREQLIAERMNRLETIRLKGKINYEEITSLSYEARQKLKKIDPETIAQANRIPGVSPSDINVLLLLMGR